MKNRTILISFIIVLFIAFGTLFLITNLKPSYHIFTEGCNETIGLNETCSEMVEVDFMEWGEEDTYYSNELTKDFLNIECKILKVDEAWGCNKYLVQKY